MTSLYDLTSPDVRRHIDDRPIAVLPFGSIEQHGPHLPCGTDTMAADLVAVELAHRIGGLHAPFCPYGVTPIHAGHPGTVTLRRRTFEALLTDVCNQLIEMGTKTLIFVNWHEINTPSLDAVATDLQEETGTRVFIAQACYVAQRIYADDGGRLTHGGSIETMAVMAHDPSLLKVERAGKPSRPPDAEAKDAMRRSKEVYGFVTDVSEIAADGWYGDPMWATRERAATFPEAVVDDIAKQLDAIEALEVAR